MCASKKKKTHKKIGIQHHLVVASPSQAYFHVASSHTGNIRFLTSASYWNIWLPFMWWHLCMTTGPLRRDTSKQRSSVRISLSAVYENTWDQVHKKEKSSSSVTFIYFFFLYVYVWSSFSYQILPRAFLCGIRIFFWGGKRLFYRLSYWQIEWSANILFCILKWQCGYYYCPSSSRSKHNMCDFECVRESDWLLNLRIVSCNHQARIFMTCFFFSFSWLFTKAVESAAAAVAVPAHSPGCRPCRGSWRSQLSRSPFFPCCLRTGWSQHSWSVLVQTQVTKRVSSLSAHFWPPGKRLASFGDGNKPSPDSISEMLTSHCASSRHIKPSEFKTDS